MNPRVAAGLGSLLLLAACHRSKVAEVTLDEEAAAQNATAAKTLADLAAAEAAARAPVPPRSALEPPPPAATNDSVPVQAPKPRPAAAPAADEAPDVETNATDAGPQG